MARYPTFEEYQKRGNFDDGIKRCDELLKRNPNDVELLTVKLQLVYATRADGGPILDQLLSIQPSVSDLRELVAIEEAVIDSQRDVFPRPKSGGAALTKLWENAFKASGAMNQKLDLQSLRFSRAIVNDRLGDAQQALIQLKVLQPKNRAIYMAHAAVTQLLSDSKEDLQSRLALSLARKAVTDKFDTDKSLDWRVPGQIFALQDSAKDLDGIQDRAFSDSKQVFNALRKTKTLTANGVPTAQQSKDPATVPSADWLYAEVNGLKQQFADLVTSNAQVDVILKFAANAIRLFTTSSTSITDVRGRGQADACFLSVSALVRAFEQTDQVCYLLQAAYLAETLLQYNTHIHEVRVVLVYVYMRLGLGSLAMRMFDSLSVKEIQHDTIGHALFTRLSYTHPHSTTLARKSSFDPLQRTFNALSVYARCEDKLAENEASVLSHGQTGMIFDLHELRENLRTSLSRRVILLEQRRMDRLVHGAFGEDTASLGAKVTANWVTMTDNRDFSSTFDYGYNVEKVLHGQSGTLPGRTWILYTLVTDLAWCMAMQSSPPISDSADKIFEELSENSVNTGVTDDGAASLGMSNAEYLAGDLACQVLKFLQQWAVDPTNIFQEVDGVVQAVDRLNVGDILSTDVAFPERIVDHYAYLDVLRLVVRSCSITAQKTPHSADELQRLGQTARTRVSDIQNRATNQKKRIRTTNVETLLKQNGEVWKAFKPFGRNSIQSFCESVAASAKEGWEGLTNIKPM